MVEPKSPHQIVKSILRLPNDGPLNSFDKYLKAAEYLNLEIITQDEVIKALHSGITCYSIILKIFINGTLLH